MTELQQPPAPLEPTIEADAASEAVEAVAVKEVKDESLRNLTDDEIADLIIATKPDLGGTRPERPQAGQLNGNGPRPRDPRVDTGQGIRYGGRRWSF